MGKNQTYKAMQRAKVAAGSTGPEEINDGMVDGSFHSPEWHAARLASLNTSQTVTWEEFKRKRKEEEIRKGEMEADTDRMMREYRAQLDAERASKLAQGRNYSSSKSGRKKDKGKYFKKRSRKKKKHGRTSSDSSSSSSSSETSGSDDADRESKRSKSKRKKKEKRCKSRSKRSRSDHEDSNGPLPLSRFFGSKRS